MVFEKVLEIVANQNGMDGIPSLEVVSVGGKGLFNAHQKLLQACHVEWVVIADRDYIEQVGSGDVKNLFALNAAEVRNDVIRNVKSLDGAALVRRIDEAMASGNWEDAQDLWAYIKSHRVMLRDNLDAGDRAIFDDFIAAKEAENLFILARGDLEDYLPEGYRSKDIESLIALVNSENFWDQMPARPRADLERIAKIVLKIPTPA